MVDAGMAMSEEGSYASFKKKYDLPVFIELDREFDVGALEDHTQPLKLILHKCNERVEFYAGILTDILQPDPSNIAAMHETRHFSDEQKKKLYSLYKRLMKQSRAFLHCMLENNEEDQARELKKFYAGWENIKKELLDMVIAMRDSWDVQNTFSNDLGYLG